MKASRNFHKVSPREFAKARDTVRTVNKSPGIKPIEFRNHLSYNTKDPKSYSLGAKKS
jgi:hypothetical protein